MPQASAVADSRRQFRALSFAQEDSFSALSVNPPLLEGAFTPTSPRHFGPLFVGREAYMRRLISAIRDERAHVVLYGDRGVGKTSLTYAFGELARRSGYIVIKKSCGGSTSYDGLFGGILDTIAGSRSQNGGRELSRSIGPEQTVETLAAYSGGRLLVFIDEFDRVQEEKLRQHIAETIKNLSDRGVPVTLVLVGVARNLSDLIGQHPSIQRNIVGIRLEPMSRSEIGGVIDVGAKAAGATFNPRVRDAIASLARGMPYYAHSLCLFSVRAALARASKVVAEIDLQSAIQDMIDAQDPDFGRQYASLCKDPESTVLLEKAAAAFDSREGFLACDIGATDTELAGLTSGSGDAPLNSEPAAIRRYYFAQPAFVHYVLLRGAALRRFPPGNP